MIEAMATARNVRTSAQKAGLVCDLIRGKDVNRALATLQFTKKTIARELAKVLRSAVANAQQKEGFGGDVERLYVLACYANQGPSMKRVRPAPMGRAFRVVKRTAHLTVRVAEHPLKIAPVAVTTAAAAPEAPAPEAPAHGRKKPAARKTAAPKATTAKKKTAKKKTAKKG
jgi:large subunit ribosomal protein L22